MNSLDFLDWHVGDRIQRIRSQRRLSLHAVATEIGVSEDEMRDFEGGVRRVGAPRLLRLAKLFDVHVGEFFKSPAPDGFAWLAELRRRTGNGGSNSCH
jgi:transcriptional regulator with XRE-family HTH domain